jgi:SAM-dependent methyltransferase
MSTIAQCRSCGATRLQLILSLGRTPLANALLTETQLAQPEETYPLDLVFCPDCALVQITETVPPERLFRDYLYFSSFADTVVKNARAIAEHMMHVRQLDATSLVIEIASNDGYLLQNYRAQGIPVLGIEPALNIARVAGERGIPTLPEFFDLPLARQLKEHGQRADVIHANNVLAHVADLHGVVAGLALLLKSDGVAVIEVPYVKDLIDRVEFDTIYHEHLCYFSLSALDRLFRDHGLSASDVERIPIHGGSLRVFVKHTRRGSGARSSRTMQLLAEETEWGAHRFDFYLGFGKKVEQLRGNLSRLLRQLKAEG